ncbi:hypothetical protein H5410_014538 [Solanum commersonii]|uniref:Uncharacterized protein n=1 Tax=Solanum commersonii TaxID=4109 RepID=A0A9J5ZRN8_SOLCO|nr:hypothetical protein H5410_014538 [Solanum commersonii]
MTFIIWTILSQDLSISYVRSGIGLDRDKLGIKAQSSRVLGSCLYEELLESIRLGGMLILNSKKLPNAPEVQPLKGDVTNVKFRNVIQILTQVVTEHVARQGADH